MGQQAGATTTGAEMIPEQLTDALAATPSADDWQCTVLREDEAQLYLIGARVEEQRRVTNTRAVVALYNDHPPASGDASANQIELRLILMQERALPVVGAGCRRQRVGQLLRGHRRISRTRCSRRHR